MNKILYNNYHTHTTYCRHSSNELENLIKLAIEEKYKKLGISEHCPYPLIKERWPTVEELDQLIKEFLIIKKKYKKQIKLFFGIESEYCKEEHEYFYNLRHKKNIDYFIYGNHYIGNMTKKFVDFSQIDSDKTLDVYYNQAKDALSSQLFSAFAHPDYIFRYYKKWDSKAIEFSKKLIDLSIKYDVPLCINGNGMFYKKNEFDYPCAYFWEIVSKSKAKVLLETDSHSYEILLQKNNEKLFGFVKEMNLEENLIDDMEIK